jgi:antitoxin (DNA-binding transcriptional repressor) of toxin-antitoxin stability system
MIRINIHEAKVHLSRYLDKLLEGETVVLCRRNVPIAELKALPRRRQTPRPIGLAADTFTVPSSFFDPLPPDLEAAFSGESL